MSCVGVEGVVTLCGPGMANIFKRRILQIFKRISDFVVKSSWEILYLFFALSGITKICKNDLSDDCMEHETACNRPWQRKTCLILHNLKMYNISKTLFPIECQWVEAEHL